MDSTAANQASHDSEIVRLGTKLKAELLGDKRKACMLLGLLALAAFVIARALMTGGPPARSSAAAPKPKPIMAALAGTERLSTKAKADQDRREEYLQRIDRAITRDLFKTSPDFFPLPGSQLDAELVQSAAQSPQDLADPGFLGGLTRQVRERQQVQREQLAKLSYVKGQAEALSLQTTIMGAVPTALINGQVLHVGQEIQGFTVQSISANCCVVVKDGVEVPIPMRKPEGK